ncbi:hypothetical protein DdX_16693 [Ditylenchus destructor]|uniref:Uncharacterized protein n=1 Tax=Ditylenchus destructor TaxID=166010 RepID=A0AAD4MPZ8_9BILA|nr:hypothetical protein DdX_16693 [Ditylenchus destructor]
MVSRNNAYIAALVSCTLFSLMSPIAGWPWPLGGGANNANDKPAVETVKKPVAKPEPTPISIHVYGNYLPKHGKMAETVDDLNITITGLTTKSKRSDLMEKLQPIIDEEIVKKKGKRHWDVKYGKVDKEGKFDYKGTITSWYLTKDEETRNMSILMTPDYSDLCIVYTESY